MRRPHRFDIHRIDLDRPVRALTVGPRSCGVALEFYRKTAPVGFLMKSLKPGTTVAAATIEAGIAAEALGLKDQQDVPDSVDTPSVSVAICTKDHPDLLTRCLEGLEALDAGNIPLEILIIDNGSRGQE